LRRIFDARFRLGMFHPDGQCRTRKFRSRKFDALEHARQARPAGARDSFRLVEEHRRPAVGFGQVRHLAVIGANADSLPMRSATTTARPATVTVLKGIRNGREKATWKYVFRGCPWS